MDSSLSVEGQDVDEDNDHRVSMVTSEHGYTMLLSQMNSDHPNNNILSSYSGNLSDDDSYHSNSDDMGDLRIHDDAMDDTDALDESPKYVDIQLGIDLSVPSEDECSKDSKPGDTDSLVSNNSHHLSSSDPILTSAGQVILTNQQSSSDMQSHGSVVRMPVDTVVESIPPSPGHMLQSEDSVIQFARPLQQPICVKIYVPAPTVAEVFDCKWLDCARQCTSLNELVNHVNDDHVKLGSGKEAEYKCFWKECPRKGKGFNARYKMLIHVRTHTNEKPHRCSTCGKCFSRLENLKIHTRSHTGERPYLCPVEGCNKAYSNSSDRFKHVRTHQEEKPYCCRMPGCRKRYTDPSSLRKHIKTNKHQFRGSSFHENDKLKLHTSAANRTFFNATKPANAVLLGSALRQRTVIQQPAGVSGNTADGAFIMYAPSAGRELQKVISPSGARQVNIVSVQNSLHPPTANPLLSSTIRTGAMSTPKKDSPLALTTHVSVIDSPIKDLSSSSESSLIEHVTKDQEVPLDLSTSPSAENNVQSRTSSHGLKWMIKLSDT